MKKTAIIFLCVLLVSVNIFTEEKKTSSNQEKYFAMAKVPPLSDFEYELTEDMEGVKITKYKGEALHVLIPNEIEGMPVVELGDYSFRDRKKTETVVMPSTIKKVGNDLFYFCKALKNVKLSSAITSIPDGMFSGCMSLEKFTIPKNITNIGSLAFNGCNLKSIYIPDTVISFLDRDNSPASYIFSRCENLESVHLPSSITYICNDMFSKCSSLHNIKLPSGLKKIGRSAFIECSSLTKLEIPNTVTAIHYQAFDNSGLKSLTIPDSVTELECSFATCKSLEYLRLPNSITIIDHLLFHDQYDSSKRPTSLKSLNLPKSLQKLTPYALAGLNSLNELIIPDSVINIEFLTDNGTSNQAFIGTSLPLLTQKKLKQMGYTGKF